MALPMVVSAAAIDAKYSATTGSNDTITASIGKMSSWSTVSFTAVVRIFRRVPLPSSTLLLVDCWGWVVVVFWIPCFYRNAEPESECIVRNRFADFSLPLWVMVWMATLPSVSVSQVHALIGLAIANPTRLLATLSSAALSPVGVSLNTM